MAAFFGSFGGQWKSEKKALAVKKEEKKKAGRRINIDTGPSAWEIFGVVIATPFLVLWATLRAVWWFLTRKWFWTAAAIVGGGYFGWQLIRYLVFQLTFGQLFLPG